MWQGTKDTFFWREVDGGFFEIVDIVFKTKLDDDLGGWFLPTVALWCMVS